MRKIYRFSPHKSSLLINPPYCFKTELIPNEEISFRDSYFSWKMKNPNATRRWVKTLSGIVHIENLEYLERRQNANT